eukprot:TRINITY_DN15000_c0_g1_i1.p1 TRINITY_DN15000_c0_g1~~TRINITY_DN15000_c0_g1_i1.p1  ORF type:complete len:310 (+),score=80.07 TRINITY_DN15000_c0_g1_i1:78-1007(+)
MSFTQEAPFWADEAKQVLLDLNFGFVQPETASEVCARAREAFKIPSGDLDTITPATGGREDDIVIRDANRTFSSTAYRNRFTAAARKLIELLGYEETMDYHQGEGYLLSYLLLLLPAHETITLMHTFGSDVKYTPGYYKSAPAAFNRDCNVLQRILDARDPELSAALRRHGIVMETFVQKWVVALGVHALPFRHIFQVVSRFIEHGWVYLFQLVLAMLASQREPLLKADVTRMSQLLRLEKLPDLQATGDDILKRADEVSLDMTQLEAWREEEMVKVEERLARAAADKAAAQAEMDEIEFSDETDDDSD